MFKSLIEQEEVQEGKRGGGEEKKGEKREGKSREKRNT